MDREETHMHNNGMTGKGAEAKKTKAKETAANVTKELGVTLDLRLIWFKGNNELFISSY